MIQAFIVQLLKPAWMPRHSHVVTSASCHCMWCWNQEVLCHHGGLASDRGAVPPWDQLVDSRVAEMCLWDLEGQGARAFHLDGFSSSPSWACFLVSLSRLGSQSCWSPPGRVLGCSNPAFAGGPGMGSLPALWLALRPQLTPGLLLGPQLAFCPASTLANVGE